MTICKDEVMAWQTCIAACICVYIIWYIKCKIYCKKKTNLDWSVHVGLFITQHNLPGDSDSIEEVVDESHVVDESVHVAGAQHK